MPGFSSEAGSDLGATEAPTPPLPWAGAQSGGSEIFPETWPSWHIQSQATQREDTPQDHRERAISSLRFYLWLVTSAASLAPVAPTGVWLWEWTPSGKR